ncbi:MAG TPA: FadR/GntR family transcriptional regulator [Pseudonocardiaceae bacterium]|jgi:DNA-binding FadR family transcriptional regulator|nr:FadR/GntR family transcriptional regulator [Pseudonocardiaceae bacterium]
MELGAGEQGMFTTVSSNRMSEAIVAQIRTLIRTGRIVPGDRLPSERELCEQFGVSRVTVREALRVLEAGGLIEIRVGARGGAFVTTPTSDQLSAGLADLINLAPVTAVEVTEARLVFELGIIPMVVERATEQDIEELREMTREHIAALKRGDYAMSMSAQFHNRVGACTHNAAIEMLVHSFHGPLLMSLREARTAAPVMGQRGVYEHRDFVEAIAERNVEEATAIMRRHVERTAKVLSKAKD